MTIFHIQNDVVHNVLWFDNYEFIMTRHSKLCITDEFVACISFQMVNMNMTLWCQHTLFMINQIMDLDVLSDKCEMIYAVVNFQYIMVSILAVHHTYAHSIKLSLCGPKFGFRSGIQIFQAYRAKGWFWNEFKDLQYLKPKLSMCVRYLKIINSFWKIISAFWKQIVWGAKYCFDQKTQETPGPAQFWCNFRPCLLQMPACATNSTSQDIQVYCRCAENHTP